MRIALVAVAVLALAAGAVAATPVEDRLNPTVSRLSGKPSAHVHCWAPANWDTYRSARGVPADAAAFVVRGSVAIDASPALCGVLRTIAEHPPGTRCRVGTKTVTKQRRVWRWRPVTVAGKRKRIRVRVTVTRRETVPVFGVCVTTPAQLDALWTIAHETAHVAGVVDEATAECDGLQTLDEIALALGAVPAAADLAARQAAAAYGSVQPPEYVSPDCREGGALDRTPGDGRWP